MEIKTAFKINDLVQHKFQVKSSFEGLSDLKMTAKFFEVIYIHTETCSAGTQIFYHCRAFYPTSSGYKEEKKISSIEFSLTPIFNHEGLYKFREDEIKIMSDDEKSFYRLS